MNIVIDRAELDQQVDLLMDTVYYPEANTGYTREDVADALWAWLQRAVADLVEEACGYTHDTYAFQSRYFNQALYHASRRRKKLASEVV